MMIFVNKKYHEYVYAMENTHEYVCAMENTTPVFLENIDANLVCVVWYVWLVQKQATF